MNIKTAVNIGKRILSSMLTAAMLLVVLLPVCALASEGSGGKTVKIGWYHSALFQEGLSDSETKSGYSYEYIHKIADYNGWEYEYVYGDWSELFAKLESGEIDILAGVSKTAERMDKILYPDEIMGNEHYVLYQLSDNKTMDASDLRTFEGKKIGAITNNLMTTCLENWLKEKNAGAEIVYYESFDERDSDFAAGKLDALVTTDNGILLSTGYTQITRVGSDSYYLAVTKGREDLLIDLNRAQSLIQDVDPYYLNKLEYQCYGTTLANSSLSSVEQEWLDSHSELVIGYLEDYLPYCATDTDGKVCGIITDVMEAILSKLNISDRITVVYKAYSDSEIMTEAVKNGEIDAAFPVGGEIHQLEKRGIKATNDVVTSNVYLVFRGDSSSDAIKRIAVNEGNAMMGDYLSEAYPDAEVIEYSSINECLDAVLEGKADATTVNGLRLNIVQKNREYSSLSLQRMEKTSGRCFGAASGNTGLQVLLNRGIKLIGTDFGNNAAYNYMNKLYQLSLTDILLNHPVVFGCLILAILAAIIAVMLSFQRRTKRFLALEEEKNRALSLQQKRLEEAAEEQEAHIEEMTALNAELEERQAQLEEATAEQESQLEEIGLLNAQLNRAKTDAEAANEAKTSFLFNMSHDIRTPMNAIIGFRELLEKYQEDPERRADYLHKIEDSSNVLLSIINNVLEMARIEKGSIELDEAAWSVEQFNDTIHSIFIEMMQQKGISFTREVNIQHPYVHCDPIKLREVFINILSNAYKYTEPGGSVHMSLEELPSEREGYALFRTTVSDTGIGMSEEFVEHIFEEFSRERSSTENKIEGTGLGMPIVKRLVELMGGTIEVKSKKGEGSSFAVTLYHRIGEKSDLVDYAGVEIDPISFEGKRILLAEDNDLNAEIAVEILSEAGFLVDRAENGLACCQRLDQAGAGFYDVILMDIQMPKMNGYEATRAIRSMKDKAKAEIPIIAMTANAFEEDKKNAIASGMNNHVAKPIQITELLSALAGVLN